MSLDPSSSGAKTGGRFQLGGDAISDITAEQWHAWTTSLMICSGPRDERLRYSLRNSSIRKNEFQEAEGAIHRSAVRKFCLLRRPTLRIEMGDRRVVLIGTITIRISPTQPNVSQKLEASVVCPGIRHDGSSAQ